MAEENETSTDMGNLSSTTEPEGIKVSGIIINFKVVPEVDTDTDTVVGSETIVP